MQLISNLQKLQASHQNLVVTIGNFDGVHRGHQHLMEILKKTANLCSKSTLVITFEPSPAEYFSLRTATASIRLTSLREKITQLQKQEIDYVLRLKFNTPFANLSAEAFIDDLLVKRLKVAHLIVGEDFRFGKNRAGDVHLLAKKANENKFSLDVVKKIKHPDEIEPISSTRIREALSQHNFAKAQQLLGRAYSLSGRVIQGQRLGRTLGFPTANVHRNNLKPPISGVFAVHVLGLGKEPLGGVANIGKKPTVNGLKSSLEVHLFNFNQSIYGRYVTVVPLKKIRDEKKFPHLHALSSQIANDVISAKEILEY